MKGVIISDWRKANFNTREGRNKIAGAVNHFLNAPNHPALKNIYRGGVIDAKGVKLADRVSHFSNSDNFPAEIRPVINRYHRVPTYDMAWENLFDVIDFRSQNVSSWDILDVTSGLVFKKVNEGEKALVYQAAGEKVTVSFDKYGGGLNWTKEFIMDGQYWRLEDNAIQFRDKWFDSVSQNHYDLIEALPTAQNEEWADTDVASSDPNYQAIRDIITINNACVNILEDLKDLGYVGLSANSTFQLFAPIQLWTRLERAFKLSDNDRFSIPFNINRNYTMHFTSKDSYYVAIPGYKIQSGNRMDLTVEIYDDKLSFSETAVGFGRYGAAIGETKQIRRIASTSG